MTDQPIGPGDKFGQELTPRERRVAALLALGYGDAKIGRKVGPPFGPIAITVVGHDIKSACEKLGVGRHGLVLWILDHLKDEDRARMVAAAERRREQLRASGVLRPVRVQLALLLAHPETCDLSNDELGQLLEPKVSGTKVPLHLRAMYENIGPDGCAAKLVAIMHLAPLSARTTSDDDPEDAETL